jgi:tetrahydromethanopterin S-methyltransferase subunit F
MNQFRSAIATQLHVSVAQVTILDVKPGSIVVVFAVQAANLDTVQQQLDDDISSQSFQFTFSGRSLTLDNTQVTYQKQVGSLDENDDSGSNTAVIVGVVFGVVAVVALIVVIVLLVYRKKTQSKDTEIVAYSKGPISNMDS